jgi:hypothetical protein
MAIDINFGALQQANPFAAYQQGQEIGQQRRQMQARQQAGNVFASDPDQAAQILMSAGDYEDGMAARKYATEERQTRSRAAALHKAAAGDLPGAQKDALDANDVETYKVVSQMSDDQRKVAAQQNEDRGGYAATLLGQIQAGKMTEEQARAHIQEDKPKLMSLGWTSDQVDNFVPSVTELQRVVNDGLGLKGILERADKDRTYNLDADKFGETKRHNRAGEANAGAQVGVAQGNLGIRRQEFQARRAAGGFGTPGAGAVPELPPGFVMEK